MFKGKTKHGVDLRETAGMPDKSTNHHLVLVADGAGARLIQHSGNELVILEDIPHPEGRKTSSELGTDRPGRGNDSSSGAPHSFAPEVSMHDQSEITFAKSLAGKLEHIRKQNRLTQLTLVSDSKFMGRLNPELSTPLSRLVTGRIQKNLTKMPWPELKAHLLKEIG